VIRNCCERPSNTNGDGSFLLTTLEPSVQASVLDRLGDVCGLDFFAAGEIGDGAADFEDPAVGAGA
jgi:hypothetical protein